MSIVAFVLLLLLTQFGSAAGFIRLSHRRSNSLVSSTSLSDERLRWSSKLAAKKAQPGPPSPAPQSGGGVEPKYVYAFLVFIGACVFDFFRMHGGVAPWEPGGFL